MKWKKYLEGFDKILLAEEKKGVYTNPAYVEYVKLNRSRVKRWVKRGKISDQLRQEILMIDEPQKWILITEHWCGDAANIAPFLHRITELNENISFEIQLRDSEQSEIGNYLTNGGKAIPKLIVRDKDNTDLFTWGPRPMGAYELVQQHKKSDLTPTEKKAELQHWYNNDKGLSFQQELHDLVLQHATQLIA